MNDVEKIKEVSPYKKISGMILNLSFGFHGVPKILEPIYSVFLNHVILNHGMDVVNLHELLVM